MIVENASEYLHSPDCPFSGHVATAFARLKYKKDFVTLSAMEASLLNEILDCAKDDDKDIHIDMVTGDTYPYSIAYGGIFVSEWYKKEHSDDLYAFLEKDLNENFIGCGLIDVDKNYKNIIASVFRGAVLIPERRKIDDFIPCAILMQTEKDVDSLPAPTSFFFTFGRLLWEDIMNRPFVFSIRSRKHFAAFNENADKMAETVADWKDSIDVLRLLMAYDEANIVKSR